MGNNKFGTLFLALSAFATLIFEFLLAYLIEPAIYNTKMSEWNNQQIITHWIITCIVWLILSICIIKYANTKYQINLFQKTNPMSIYQIIAVILLILIKIYISYKSWDGFKVVEEFNNLGTTKFIFQYIYYSCEVFLVTLILIFGQMFFERLFNNPNIPYGGIMAAITWGLGHILSKDYVTGILSALVGLGFGSVYLLTNCNVVLTYILVWIMFVI